MRLVTNAEASAASADRENLGQSPAGLPTPAHAAACSRQRILFIGHDATVTGAPNSLLKIIRWIRAHTPYQPIALLGKGGPMLARYAEVCETHVWQPLPEQLRSAGGSSGLPRWLAFFGQARLAQVTHRRAIRSRLRELAPICVFNNTGVNGDLLRNLQHVVDAPVVSRIPELEGFMRRNLHTGSLRGVMQRSQHFIAVSAAVKENLMQRHGVPAERVSVVYGACDETVDHPREAGLRAELRFDRGDFVVCGCGTMDWRKGFDLFLQTAYRVCVTREQKDIRFVWIGEPINSDTEIEYRWEIEKLGLGGSLTLTGRHPAPAQLFAQCDLFFLSSREDPFPLVMLEAARQGLPLLCFDRSGGATEFVLPDLGTVVPELDVETAAHTILQRAADREGTRTAGERARARAKEFTVDRMGAEVAKVIGDIVAGSTGAVGRPNGAALSRMPL